MVNICSKGGREHGAIPENFSYFLAEGRRAIFLLTISLTRGVCWVELALRFF